MTSSAPARPAPRTLLPTLAGYRREWLILDVIGGLSAGAVVVPQAMAYATIANLPVQVGLYTCIVPMLVYAFLGRSQAMSVSTTSTIATLTATTLVTAGVAASAQDPDAALGALVTLTLLVGVVLLIARLLNLGSLVENISAATVLGIKIGVGATVAVGQLPKLLGESGNPTGEGFFRSLIAVVDAFDSANWPTIALSIGSIAVLIVLQRIAPRLPGTLIVVATGILLAAFTGITSLGVVLIDPVPSGFPIPRLPDLALVADLVPGALAIAVMAFLESAAVARGIRRATEPPIDSNRELFATGAANVVGAFFTAMPAAGGFSQSAVNQAAGAKTQLSSIVTVALAVLVALLFGPVLSLLPEATLAAMVFVAVVGLIDIPELIRWARISPRDFWIALAVALIGLSAGLLAAVAVGVVLTLILVLREINIPRLRIIDRRGHAIAIHLGQGLYTGNALENERAIIALAMQNTDVRSLVLDVDRLDIVTVTVLEALEELDRELSQLGIELHLARLPESAATIARHMPWYSGLETNGRTHASVEEGLVAASGRSDGEERE